MIHHVFFGFTAGLKKSIKVPKGTLARLRAHVVELERRLGLQRDQYRDNPPHWSTASKRFDGIDNEIVCEAVEEHNSLVRWLYDRLADQAFNGPAEKLTPKAFAKLLPALQMLDVESERWTKEYYKARMETLYEVMRGRETDGISFNAKALTPEQAGAAIVLFSQFLDTHDIRLDVPWKHDSLAESDAYRWCEKCGIAVVYDDLIEMKDGDGYKCPKCKKEID